MTDDFGQEQDDPEPQAHEEQDGAERFGLERHTSGFMGFRVTVRTVLVGARFRGMGMGTMLHMRAKFQVMFHIRPVLRHGPDVPDFPSLQPREEPQEAREDVRENNGEDGHEKRVKDDLM